MIVGQSLRFFRLGLGPHYTVGLNEPVTTRDLLAADDGTNPPGTPPGVSYRGGRVPWGTGTVVGTPGLHLHFTSGPDATPHLTATVTIEMRLCRRVWGSQTWSRPEEWVSQTDLGERSRSSVRPSEPDFGLLLRPTFRVYARGSRTDGGRNFYAN